MPNLAFTLRNKQRLKAFENKIPQSTCGALTDKVTEQRKLQSRSLLFILFTEHARIKQGKL
jgi:hypothetical protein